MILSFLRKLNHSKGFVNENFEKLSKSFIIFFEVLKIDIIVLGWIWFLRPGIRLRGAFETN
jgi:hypothetical protein